MRRLKVLAAVLFVASCQAPSGDVGCPRDAEVVEQSEAEMTEIYGLVIADLVLQNSSFGPQPEFPKLFLVDGPVESAGEQPGLDKKVGTFGSRLQQELSAALDQAGLPLVEFVSSREAVIQDLETMPRVREGGGLVTVSPLTRGDHCVQVSAEFYVDGLASTGRVYQLAVVEGGWEIVESSMTFVS
ncbi:MAG: hypothetical protein ACRDVL_02980 [Acidimicrobiia bacterium]